MPRCLASCWELFEQSATPGDKETMPAVLALPDSEIEIQGRSALHAPAVHEVRLICNLWDYLLQTEIYSIPRALHEELPDCLCDIFCASESDVWRGAESLSLPPPPVSFEVASSFLDDLDLLVERGIDCD